jgi:hypothetical protein
MEWKETPKSSRRMNHPIVRSDSIYIYIYILYYRAFRMSVFLDSDWLFVLSYQCYQRERESQSDFCYIFHTCHHHSRYQFLVNLICSIQIPCHCTESIDTFTNVVQFYPDSKYNYVEHSTNSTYSRSTYCRDKINVLRTSDPLINTSPNECIFY